jgi:hypothetical protein
MTIKKQVIDHLLSNSGKLNEGETWVSIAEKFGIIPPDKERASNDAIYKRKSIARIAQRYWESYLHQKNKLELTKEIYENGKLKFETFKKQAEPLQEPIDSNAFEIEKITTNPYGGAWFKMKRKEHIHTDEHLNSLKKMLTEEINPQDYNIEEPILHDRGLFIYGADKHIGALTKKDSIYTNDYDIEEIEKRLIFKTIQNIKRTKNIFGMLESLYIMDLGDALDGYNQKTTGGLKGTSLHTLPQQMNNREQYDTYVRIHKNLFDLLVQEKLAKNIYFIATSNSNHGGDFEYCAMRNVEDYLNVKYPFIKTVVNYYPLNHFIYGNHAIIFGHGKDDEDMKSGMPLNLNDKVENYLNDYIRMNSLEMYNVTFVSADLHQSSENYGKALRYKKVLSQYGSTKWMHTNFGSGSPGLSFDIFEKNSKLIWKADDFFDIDNQSNTGIMFK